MDDWGFYKGQINLISELKRLVNSPMNIFIRGPSGYGKTFLGRLFCNSVGLYQELQGTDLNESMYFDYRAQIIFVDEIHECNCVEKLYPLIDSGRRFFFCTNESANVKEPLRNRCVERFLQHYSFSELFEIAKNLNSQPDEICKIIVDNSRGVPRVITQLSALFKISDVQTQEQALDYLHSVGIFNGYTELDLRYLEYLKTAPKNRASLSTLASVLQVSKEQLLQDVEPFLLRERKIIITNGRQLCF